LQLYKAEDGGFVPKPEATEVERAKHLIGVMEFNLDLEWEDDADDLNFFDDKAQLAGLLDLIRDHGVESFGLTFGKNDDVWMEDFKTPSAHDSQYLIEALIKGGLWKDDAYNVSATLVSMISELLDFTWPDWTEHKSANGDVHVACGEERLQFEITIFGDEGETDTHIQEFQL
jgi:hypothetical protein